MKFRGVLESACGKLGGKADISREVNISCVRFLREKLKSDQSLSQSLRQHLSLLPQKSSSDTSLSAALFSLSQHQASISTKLDSLGSSSEQYQPHRNLVKTGLADPLQEYESALKREKDTLTELVQTADRAAVKVVQLYQEYCVAYRSSRERLGKSMVMERCLWLCERRYLHAAGEAIVLLKAFAMFVVKYIKRFANLENQRIAAIHTAMKEFVELQEAMFVTSATAGNARAELDSVAIMTETSLFASLFDVNEQHLVKQMSEKDDLEEAIITWDIVVPAAIPLELAMTKVYKEEGNVWRKMKGVVSADGILHLFDKKNDPHMMDPVVSLPLSPSKFDLELNPQSLSLQLRLRLSRFKSFLNKPDTILLKFTHQRKFELWSSVITQFLPQFTVVDNGM